MANIVFLDEYSLNDADLNGIRALGNYTGYEFTAPEQVLERAANADILIVNKVKLTADIIGNLPKLRLICEAATGVDNIDVQAAAARGIPVKNAKGYSTHSVAEATLGGAIAMLREIVYYRRFRQTGRILLLSAALQLRPPHPATVRPQMGYRRARSHRSCRGGTRRRFRMRSGLPFGIGEQAGGEIPRNGINGTIEVGGYSVHTLTA